MKLFGKFILLASLSAAAQAGPGVADRQLALETLTALKNRDVLVRDLVSDGADRMRLADRLTMLTQRVAASSCALTSDVAVEESHFHLEHAMHETDIILDALRYGNETLHILGPETSRRTMNDIDALWEEWRETHGAVEAVLSDGHDVDNAHVIDDHNLKLLDKASIVAADILGQYAHPFEMTQADALVLSLAGRQRMLTQKMAKDACEIWTGYHAEDGRADLVETMQIFETSLTALRFGMPELGVQPAPTEEIALQLDSVLARWQVIRGNLEKLLAGETLNADQKYEIFHDFNVEQEEIETIIESYKIYVERHHTG